MKKHWFKRLKRMTALGLAALLTAAAPIQAAAEISRTIRNTPSENKALLTALTELTGGEKEAGEIYAQLEALGLIGPDGRVATKKILVDGEEKTIDQVLDMIEEETDLSKKVSVDGTELTLGDLKLMAEIEAELARIERDYFNEDVVLTDEHREALDSLKKQVRETGITMTGLQDEAVSRADVPVTSEIILASGYDHGARLYVAAEAPYETVEDRTTVPNQDLTFNMVFRLNKKLDYDVSFHAKTMDGSAEAGVNYQKLEDQKFVIKKGETGLKIPIKIKKEDTNWKVGNKIWDGSIVFFLQINLTEGILLSASDSKNNDVGTLSKAYPILIENDMSFEIKNFPYKAGSVEQEKGDKPVHIDIKPVWEDADKMNYLLKNNILYLQKETYPTGTAGTKWANWYTSTKELPDPEPYPGWRGIVYRTVYSPLTFNNPSGKKQEIFDRTYGGFIPEVVENDPDLSTNTNEPEIFHDPGDDRFSKDLSDPILDEKSLSDFTEAERSSMLNGGLDLSTYMRDFYWITGYEGNLWPESPIPHMEYRKAKTNISVTTRKAKLVPSFRIPDGEYRLRDSIPAIADLYQPVYADRSVSRINYELKLRT